MIPEYGQTFPSNLIDLNYILNVRNVLKLSSFWPKIYADYIFKIGNTKLLIYALSFFSFSPKKKEELIIFNN